MPLLKEQQYMCESSISSSDSSLTETGDHAVLMYRNFSWTDTLTIFKRLADVIQDESEVIRCRINIALIHARLGDVSSARDEFSKLPPTASNSAIACCVMAESAVAAGDSSEALAWYGFCLEALQTTDTGDEMSRFGHDLNLSVISVNIILLKTVEPRKPVETRFVGIYRLPADCLFLSETPATRATSADFSSSSRPSSLVQGVIPYGDDAISTVTSELLDSAAWTRSTSADVVSANGVLATISSPQSASRPRMAPRDARVKNSSTRDLVHFLRSAGPSPHGDAIVLDKAYTQRLLEKDSRHASVISQSSDAIETRPALTSHERLPSISEYSGDESHDRQMEQGSQNTTPGPRFGNAP